MDNTVVIVIIMVALVLATTIVVANIIIGLFKEKFELFAQRLDNEYKMQVWAAQHPEEVLPIVSLGDNAPEELKQWIQTNDDEDMIDAATAIMQEVHDIMHAPEEDLTDERTEE